MSESAVVASLLSGTFAAKHVTAAVRHFEVLVTEFQLGQWEKSIAKGGKFVEAVLKALWGKVGEAVPGGRAFKADNIINQLPQKTALAEDSLRLTIPRACRVIYDIASNRGGRHDPDEVDPNEMDATVVLSNAQWILAELIRISQKGGKLDQVAEQIETLMRRRYPHFEDIDGRLYSDIGESAREIGLMILFFSGRRIPRNELITSIKRHRFTESNARLAVGRLAGLVDADGTGIRLRLKGIKEAEKLLDKYTKE